MDPLEQKLKEEIEFWKIQIKSARKRNDQSSLVRLREALALVRFRLRRYMDSKLGQLDS